MIELEKQFKEINESSQDALEELEKLKKGLQEIALHSSSAKM